MSSCSRPVGRMGERLEPARATTQTWVGNTAEEKATERERHGSTVMPVATTSPRMATGRAVSGSGCWGETRRPVRSPSTSGQSVSTYW